jgi:four helix bundle protein
VVRGSLFVRRKFQQRTKNKEQGTKRNAHPFMKIERFEDIEGWQLARKLTKHIYAVSKIGSFSKDFGLRDQITRASGSIMHNIAEGFDGGSNAEFMKFLRYSQRSASEVQSQLYVALDQEYISEARFNDLYTLAGQARSKIGGFIAYLLRSPRK